jgi:hypothetical protein
VNEIDRTNSRQADRRREPPLPAGRHPRREAREVEQHVAQHEGAEQQGDGAGRERDQELGADDRADHREDQKRCEAPGRVADGPAPAQLEAVHHEVRDDQERDRDLHVDGERQERRAQGREPEADRALDEGGEDDGDDGGEG